MEIFKGSADNSQCLGYFLSLDIYQLQFRPGTGYSCFYKNFLFCYVLAAETCQIHVILEMFFVE